MINLELSEQEIARRASLAQLRERGIEPYPAAEFPVNAWSDDIREQFTDLPFQTDENGQTVTDERRDSPCGWLQTPKTAAM